MPPLGLRSHNCHSWGNVMSRFITPPMPDCEITLTTMRRQTDPLRTLRTPQLSLGLSTPLSVSVSRRRLKLSEPPSGHK